MDYPSAMITTKARPAKKGRPRIKTDPGTYFSMVCTHEFHERLTSIRMSDPEGDLTKAEVIRRLVNAAYRRVQEGKPWLK